MIYEANERPRHATATVAIRSKPIAPVFGDPWKGGSGCQRSCFNSTSGDYIGLAGGATVIRIRLETVRDLAVVTAVGGVVYRR